MIHVYASSDNPKIFCIIMLYHYHSCVCLGCIKTTNFLNIEIETVAKISENFLNTIRTWGQHGEILSNKQKIYVWLNWQMFRSPKTFIKHVVYLLFGCCDNMWSLYQREASTTKHYTRSMFLSTGRLIW